MPREFLDLRLGAWALADADFEEKIIYFSWPLASLTPSVAAVCGLGYVGSMLGLTRVERAYLAGFIDGEGYLGVAFRQNKRGPAYYPCLAIVNTNREVLQWIGDLIGAKVNPRPPPKKPQHRQQFYVKLTGRPASRVILAVGPYLRVKRTQAELLLQLPGYGNGVPRVGRRGGRVRTAQQDFLAEEIRCQVKALNGGSGPH